LDQIDDDINKARQDGAKVLLVPMVLMDQDEFDAIYFDIDLPVGGDPTVQPPEWWEHIADEAEELLSLFTGRNQSRPVFDAALALKRAHEEDRLVVVPMGDFSGSFADYDDIAVTALPGLVKDQVVLAVGSSRENSNEAYIYSGSSPIGSSTSNTFLDFIAPGVSIWAPTPTSDTAYEEVTTTTAASAIVGGIGSLLMSEYSYLKPEDVRQILRRTAVDAGAPGYDRQSGFGRVDASAALDYLQARNVYHGVARDGTSTPVSWDDSQGFFGGVWGGVASGMYLVEEVRRVRFSVPVDGNDSNDIWVRFDGTVGYAPANPLFQRPHAQVIYSGGSTATLETYVYKVATVSGNDRFWVPSSPEDARVAYTVATTGPLPPPRASFDGPGCLLEGYNGTYRASGSGGRSPYTYTWSYQPVRQPGCGLEGFSRSDVSTNGLPCGGWGYAGAGQTISYGSSQSDDFRLRVRVRDSEGQTAYSSSWVIDVTPSGCEGEPLGNATVSPPSEAAGRPAVSAVDQETTAAPPAFVLDEVYPNPFVSAAEVRFGLPEPADVTLVVYDMLGREVARLADGPAEAGWHRARLDAIDLPGGVYVVQLRAGGSVESVRVTLVR
jgi:hypothetical protein